MANKYNRRFETFSGKESEWYKSSRKFLVYANNEDYIGILEGMVVIPGEKDILKDTEVQKLMNRNKEFEEAC